MVPQSMMADANLSDGSKTITITTTAAGQVSDMVSSLTSAQKAAITKIVLNGKFNSSDLAAIQSSEGFSAVETVDMSEAQFVKTASNSNNYQLFHGSASGTGTQAVENATLYQWVNTPQWEGINTTPADGVTVYDYTPNDVTGRSVGDYGRVPTTDKYLQMSVTDESWTGPVSPVPSSYTGVTWLEHELNNYRSLYKKDESVRLKRYYRKQLWERFVNWSDTNVPTPDEGKILFNGNWYGDGHRDADMNKLLSSSGSSGDYIWFNVIYQYTNGKWVRKTEFENQSTDPVGAGTITLKYDLTGAQTDDQIMGKSGSEGEYMRARWYYKKRADGEYIWEKCYPTSSNLSGETIHDGAGVGADMNNLLPNMGGQGDYIWFYVYYTKNETRNWTGETTEAPGTYKTANFDYAYRDNHKMEYDNGDWVKMSEYNYYQVKLTGPAHWELVTYTDGETYPISKFFDSGTTIETLNNGSNNGSNVGEYAVVGGPKKSYINNAWIDYNSSATVPDYSQMDFRYWKSSITKAITSKYADGTIPNELFQECYRLTNIEYLGGVVKGLNDHSPSQYANYEILIGKNVTEIAPAAFNQSRSLTKITFDNDYSSLTEEEKLNYPKPLTIGNNAFNDCNYLLEVEIPNRTVSIGNDAFAKVGNANIDLNDVEKDPNKSREFKLSFERRCHEDGLSSNVLECDFPLTIGVGAFLDCYFLKHLSLPIRLESLGGDSFKNTVQLKELVMRETTNCTYTPEGTHHLLKTIPDGAFSGSHVEEVTIPKSVTLIENNAFGSTNYLAKVTFQEQTSSPQEPLIIKSGAFTGGNENIIPHLHVYVNINPANRKIVCEYNAFNFTQMMGQTATTNEHRGTLHFNEEDWDYYQGDWKKGLAFRQDNLNAFKDGYSGRYEKVVNEATGETTTITLIGLASEENRASDTNFEANALNGKYTYGTESDEEYAPANGWQQFASTSTGIDVIIPGGSFIRTYSTSKKYDIPKTKINMVETDLVKVYRVTNFSDGYNGQNVLSGEAAGQVTRTATALRVVNTSTKEPCYIPKNTGLIMVGNVEENSSYLTYFKERADDVNEPEYTYEQITSETGVNLLVPTCDETVTLNPTDPYPIGTITESNESSRYRIFGFHKTEHYFARVQPNVKLGKNRAYMKLPANLFHWANEPKTGNGTDYIESGSSARILLSFGDETDGSDITEIGTVNSNSIDDDCFYTIQGVKLSQPHGRGLYIHKGKKIFVR